MLRLTTPMLGPEPSVGDSAESDRDSVGMMAGALPAASRAPTSGGQPWRSSAQRYPPLDAPASIHALSCWLLTQISAVHARWFGEPTAGGVVSHAASILVRSTWVKSDLAAENMGVSGKLRSVQKSSGIACLLNDHQNRKSAINYIK